METTSKKQPSFPSFNENGKSFASFKKKTAILKFGLRPVVSQERRGT
jgi:hypothetical protein